jgi:hypothetical protein
MSQDHHHLPVLSNTDSLISKLKDLDRLAAQLSSLSTKTGTETGVPSRSEGRPANIEHVKINVGGEWWVDMTLKEGEAWIGRRKVGMSSWSWLEGGG